MPATRRTRSSAGTISAASGATAGDESTLFRGHDSPASDGSAEGTAEAMQVESDLGLASTAEQEEFQKEEKEKERQNSSLESQASSATIQSLIADEKMDEIVLSSSSNDSSLPDVGVLSEDRAPKVDKSETRSAFDDREDIVEEPSSELLASLPVYLSAALPSTSSLQIFQYPTYPRGTSLPIPQSARERGLHQAMRVRSRAKRVEVELPLDLRPIVYNKDRGEQYGKGMSVGGEIGQRRIKSEFGESMPASSVRKRLEKTRLESNLLPHQTNYMLGVIRDKALHLSPIDSMHQLRPSMHYLDALEAMERQQSKHGKEDGDGSEADEGSEDDERDDSRSKAAVNGRGAAAAAAAKRKSQSVNVSIRSDANNPSGSSSGRSGHGGGAGPGDSRDALMQAEREAQSERWVELEWKDEHTDEARKLFDSQMFAVQRSPLHCTTRPREFLHQS